MSSFEFEQNTEGLFVPVQPPLLQAKQLLLFGGEVDYYTEPAECRPLHNYMPFQHELVRSVDDKFPTPVDKHGFVDVRALLDELGTYVAEDYVWRGFEDDHHEFWYERIYSTIHMFSSDELTAKQFRDLPIHVLRIPRGMHDFLHAVSLPVEAPPEKVMSHRVEGWRVACSFFDTVYQLRARKYSGNKVLGRYATKKMMKEKFSELEENMEAAAAVPEEFKLVDEKAIKRVLKVGSPEKISKSALDSALFKLNFVHAVSSAKSVSVRQALKLAA